MATSEKNLEQLTIDTIRVLSIEAIQKANSGHPGAPLGLAPVAYLLFHHFMKHNPKNPNWFDRDRFVLSCGHASMLLYSCLHLTGYELPLDQIKAFRQWDSITPGHPEYGLTPGVEVTTGPLGQGCGISVGMAIAEAHLAARYNLPDLKVVNHYTYALCSDGDLMEGVSAEAASLAGHLKLGKLIWIYDDNKITIDGKTEITFTEDVGMRFESYGWQVLNVSDGNNIEALNRAIDTARHTLDKPSLIIVKTIIGYGAPNKQGTPGVHGSPLGEAEIKLAKAFYGWDHQEAFYIPPEIIDQMEKMKERGQKFETEWQIHLDMWERENPRYAADFKRIMAGELPLDWDNDIPIFKPDEKGLATRSSGGKILDIISKRVPELIGGAADLVASTKTVISHSGSFEADHYHGRNIHFGIREHAMGAILNGISRHGGLRVFGSTFFVFSDYMRPAIRLAALMHQPVIYVWTHDSINVGEDGPTHQPVEHLIALRAIPNLILIRPADANETAAAWRVALEQRESPVGLILTRQDVPTLAETVENARQGVQKGAYILAESILSTPDVIIIASGYEVHLAMKLKKLIENKATGVRIVSMPSWELFDLQPPVYQKEILPGSALKVAIEAGVGRGWRDYVGDDGLVISLERFGASAPDELVYSRLGFNTKYIVHKIIEKLEKKL